MSSFSSDSESAAYDQMNCQHVSTSTASNFNLYYQNVRGLNTKINTFFGNVCDCEFDIVCLTETGLSSSVKSDELFGSGYSVFRRDRSFKECGLSRGGGVLIATKSTLSSSVVSIPQQYDYSIDLLAVKVKLGPNKIIVILTIYIPPSVNCDTYEKFIEFLCTLNCLLDNKECVIIGDFNSTYFSVNGTDRKSSSLQNFSSFANLTQYNCITNQDGRLLDLIFSNIECNVYEDPLPMVRVDPYHPPLNVHFAIKHTRFKNFKSNQSEWQFNYRKGNYINLYQHLCEFDWNVLPDTYDVNVMCDKFYYYLKEIFRLHIPLGPRKYSKRYPPWFSLDIIKMLKAKGKAYERYRKSPQRELYVEFQTLRSETKKLISASHKAYVHMIQNQIHEDPAKFWAFVNLQRGKSRIPGVVNYNESSHCTPTAVLNAFASFFASVFTDSDNTFCASSSINIQSLNVSLPLITNEDVVAACKKLKSKFTAGVDGIPAFLVKDCAVLFATPLTRLFNLCIQTGQFPYTWKKARICPVHKDGDISDVSNYRPISILCNFSKIFEMVIYGKIYHQVLPKISLSQHGFVKGRSTLTNLVQFTQYALSVLDKGGQLDVIYFDFRRAFDRIDHYILLYKLQIFAFDSNLVKLLESYLLGRTQYVSYEGFNSFSYPVRSGVPQGSNLGPLLFLLFMNDLPDIVKNKILLYADDVKLFREVKDQDDSHSLQNDVSKFVLWSENNRLSLSLDKCRYIAYTNKKYPVVTNYFLSNVSIKRDVVIKDLGVIFDVKLQFAEHYRYIAGKASKITGFIIRNSKSFNTECVKKLYFCYARSLLDYCSTVWSPIDQCHKMSLEKIQRRLLKYLAFKNDNIYPPRKFPENRLLERFSIPALEIRRNILAVSFLYKVVNGYIDTPEILEVIKFRVPQLQLRSTDTFYLPTARTKLLKKSPIYLMCSTFNKYGKSCDIFYDSQRCIRSIICLKSMANFQ